MWGIAVLVQCIYLSIFFLICCYFPYRHSVEISQALQVSGASYVISPISLSPFDLLRNCKTIQCGSCPWYSSYSQLK